MNFREKSLKKKGTQPPPIFRLKFTSCKGLDFETWRSLCTTQPTPTNPQPTPNQPPTNPNPVRWLCKPKIWQNAGWHPGFCISSPSCRVKSSTSLSKASRRRAKMLTWDWLGWMFGWVATADFPFTELPTYPLGSPNIASAWKNFHFWIGHTSSKGWFMFQPAMLVYQRVIFVWSSFFYVVMIVMYVCRSIHWLLGWLVGWFVAAVVLVITVPCLAGCSICISDGCCICLGAGIPRMTKTPRRWAPEADHSKRSWWISYKWPLL